MFKFGQDGIRFVVISAEYDQDDKIHPLSIYNTANTSFRHQERELKNVFLYKDTPYRSVAEAIACVKWCQPGDGHEQKIRDNALILEDLKIHNHSVAGIVSWIQSSRDVAEMLKRSETIMQLLHDDPSNDEAKWPRNYLTVLTEITQCWLAQDASAKAFLNATLDSCLVFDSQDEFLNNHYGIILMEQREPYEHKVDGQDPITFSVANPMKLYQEFLAQRRAGKRAKEENKPLLQLSDVYEELPLLSLRTNPYIEYQLSLTLAGEKPSKKQLPREQGLKAAVLAETLRFFGGKHVVKAAEITSAELLTYKSGSDSPLSNGAATRPPKAQTLLFWDIKPEHLVSATLAATSAENAAVCILQAIRLSATNNFAELVNNELALVSSYAATLRGWYGGTMPITMPKYVFSTVQVMRNSNYGLLNKPVDVSVVTALIPFGLKGDSYTPSTIETMHWIAAYKKATHIVVDLKQAISVWPLIPPASVVQIYANQVNRFGSFYNGYTVVSQEWEVVKAARSTRGSLFQSDRDSTPLFSTDKEKKLRFVEPQEVNDLDIKFLGPNKQRKLPSVVRLDSKNRIIFCFQSKHDQTWYFERLIANDGCAFPENLVGRSPTIAWEPTRKFFSQATWFKDHEHSVWIQIDKENYAQLVKLFASDAEFWRPFTQELFAIIQLMATCETLLSKATSAEIPAHPVFAYYAAMRDFCNEVLDYTKTRGFTHSNLKLWVQNRLIAHNQFFSAENNAPGQAHDALGAQILFHNLSKRCDDLIRIAPEGSDDEHPVDYVLMTTGPEGSDDTHHAQNGYHR